MSDSLLPEQEQLYLNRFPCGLFTYTADAAQQFCFVNAPFLQLLGYSEQDFRTKFHNTFPEMIYPPDRAAALAQLGAQAARNEPGDQPAHCTYRVQHANGAPVWLHQEQQLLVEPDGTRRYYAMVVDNSSSQAQIDSLRLLISCAQLLVSHGQFEDVIAQVLQTIWQYYGGVRSYIFEFDWDGGVISNTFESCAPNAPSLQARLQAWPIESAKLFINAYRRGDKLFAIMDVAELAADPGHREEYDLLCSLGVHSLVTVPIYFNQTLHGFLGVANPTDHIRDEDFLTTLTYFICNEIEKFRLHEQLRELSYVDHLTGFQNRNAYNELLDRVQKQPLNKVGVVFSDINGLKYTNDTFGHAYGDRLIANYADLIRLFFTPDQVFRISGDEFVIVCADTDELTFERCLRALEKEICRDGGELAALGYTWQQHCRDLQPPVRQAEQLMYIAKKRHYANSTATQTTIDEDMLRLLIGPENRDRYELYMQPYLSTDTGTLVGISGHVRRRSSQGRLQHRSEFVPILEQHHAVAILDKLMLDHACTQLQSWAQQGLTPPFFALSCARTTLAEPNIAAAFADICERHGIRPGQIKLEIPVQVHSLNPALLRSQLTQLKAAGFGVEIERVGSEFSSLPLLMMDGVDSVKLDYALTQRINTDPRCHLLAETVIGFCHRLGHTCIATGLEMPDQLATLRALHCDMVEGGRYDEPLSPAEFAAKYLHQPKDTSHPGG